ncbi:MAG: hypothetical protein RRZ73_05750 [Oscillospiraceae bacterium]
MNISRQNKLLEYIIIAVAIILVVFTGNILAVKFEHYRQTTTNKILDNLFLEENTIAYELLSDRRVYDTAALYLKAVIQGIAEFSYFPHDKGMAFVGIMESLPKDVNIDSFAYENKNLTVKCHTKNQSSGESFIINLQNNDIFGGIVFYNELHNKEIFYYIDCMLAT